MKFWMFYLTNLLTETLSAVVGFLVERSKMTLRIIKEILSDFWVVGDDGGVVVGEPGDQNLAKFLHAGFNSVENFGSLVCWHSSVIIINPQEEAHDIINKKLFLYLLWFRINQNKLNQLNFFRDLALCKKSWEV